MRSGRRLENRAHRSKVQVGSAVRMMIEIDASEADTDLSSLLDKVERGEEVVITRHGRPVARLVATEAARQAELDDIVERFRAAR